MSDSIKEMLLKLKKEQEQELEDDVISRTIISLLDVEKRALYGNLRNRKKPQEDIILQGLKHYREERNADS